MRASSSARNTAVPRRAAASNSRSGKIGNPIRLLEQRVREICRAVLIRSLTLFRRPIFLLRLENRLWNLSVDHEIAVHRLRDGKIDANTRERIGIARR